ncbi:Glycerophosphoryl diester phosphodiesterase [Actinomyces bovis]|uniref:Glycerophosphoryl diester phosphodiesterase n=1 Tax=Actinomyces bovis TaxID=1658 RepID=A0ABY1VNH2_9ACTO|nr:glycerophosphodiester phosphodiesterase family protein [Actinomyces bovis]SPT53659.1 Glycerophosphoryl diester phosphodiesterase [Actinomyces bovis]VEG55748.1 Glycerophosphoryl diester phosphodiesterase [Actinomyces israelii]
MSAPISQAYPAIPCPNPVPAGRRTIFAHRGARALAPENTVAAFELAGRHGAQWVELDVDVISDGTVIVIHDSRLDRTTDRQGTYYDLSAADLAHIDAGSSYVAEDGSRPFAGEPLPTLTTCLEVVRRYGMHVNVELKSCEAGAAACRRLVDGVAALLDEHAELGGAQVLVSSFNPVLLDRFGQRRPGTRLAVLTETGLLLDDWRSYVEQLGAEAVNPADRGLARERVEEIRALGYGVNVWTVNSRERAEELFSWGVTGIFTDRVHELGHLAN